MRAGTTVYDTNYSRLISIIVLRTIHF